MTCTSCGTEVELSINRVGQTHDHDPAPGTDEQGGLVVGAQRMESKVARNGRLGTAS